VNEYESAGASTTQRAKQEAAGTAGRAREAATEVAGTAAEQGRAVKGEAVAQARRMSDEVRNRVGDEAQSQARRAAQALRQWSDDLASMAEGSKPDSPARAIVTRAADGGRRAAGYLDERGFDGAIEELQRFARRRPGVFLAGAALAGLAVGRIAKAVVGPSRPAAGTGREEPSAGERFGETYVGQAPVVEPAGSRTDWAPAEPPAYDLGTRTAGQRP
jgi:hypothetical protein